MMPQKDQAAKLRALAKTQGINQKDEVLMFNSLVPQKQSPLRIVMRILRTLFVLLVLAGLGFGFYYVYENMKKDKAVIVTLTKESELLRGDLSGLHSKAEQMETQIKQSADKNVSLDKQVQSLQSSNQELKSNMGKVVEEKTHLSKALESANKKISAIERGKQDLQVTMHVQMRNLETQVEQLRTKLVSAEATVPETPKASLPPAQAQNKALEHAAQAINSGRVILVNKRLQFVVISIGKNQGVEKGKQLQLERNGSRVGDLRVIEARPEVSACEADGGVENISIGDKVKVQ